MYCDDKRRTTIPTTATYGTQVTNTSADGRGQLSMRAEHVGNFSASCLHSNTNKPSCFFYALASVEIFFHLLLLFLQECEAWYFAVIFVLFKSTVICMCNAQISIDKTDINVNFALAGAVFCFHNEDCLCCLGESPFHLQNKKTQCVIYSLVSFTSSDYSYCCSRPTGYIQHIRALSLAHIRYLYSCIYTYIDVIHFISVKPYKYIKLTTKVHHLKIAMEYFFMKYLVHYL